MHVFVCLVGQQGELNGCHNDCIAMAKYIKSIGFPDDAGHQKMMLDDGKKSCGVIPATIC
jgi:hypothetical protein